MSISYDDDETKLLASHGALIHAIRNIVANWERGDLAGAVNLARELAEEECEMATNTFGEDQRRHVDYPEMEDA
jgi:hypothetical protein